MAAAGNVFAPILFLLIYNIPNYLARWYSLKYGYSMGMEFMVKSQKSGIMDKVSYACTVVGLMAIGAMIFYTVNISTPITIGNVKNGGIVLLTSLDTVMPGMLIIALVIEKRCKSRTAFDWNYGCRCTVIRNWSDCLRAGG